MRAADTKTEIVAPSGSRSRLFSDVRALYRILDSRRRIQLAMTFAMMLVGAIAELVSIGAVLPLLALAANPNSGSKIPVLASIFRMVGAGPGTNVVLVAAFLLIGATIVSAALRLVLAWMTYTVTYGISEDIGVRVFDRLIHQPYEFYVKQNSSIALSGLEKIHLVTVGIIVPATLALTSAGIAIGIVTLLIVIDPAAAVIAAVTMGVLYVGISLVSRRVLSRISTRLSVLRTERTKAVQETLGGLRDIILDRSHMVFERKLGSIESELKHAQIVANFMSSAPRFVVEAAGITLIAVLAVYYSMLPGGVLSAIPALGALALGAQRLLPLLQTVYLGWAGAAVHAQALSDVVDLMNGPVIPKSRSASPSLPTPVTAIELAGVSFRYGNDSFALRDIDLAIRKGERIGLVGKTGSGKSTLVDVLMGLLRPTTGELLIDGCPLDAADTQAWQARIAHVPQFIFLSDESIAANIAFGADHSEVDMDQVRKAAERADILEFIEQLPQGFDTRVGERGIRLSGGQRQRIGIARALFRKAQVLFLDEATSALDSETEQAIMNSVFDLDRELTLIIIAHRLSTVARCDTVYRMVNGEIIQSGSFETVIEGQRQ